MELKATQDSVVKDLSTHTTGTVVQPGTVLLTLVPKEETLRAEVWVSNEDIGFVRQGQPVKLKFAAFPFQKYGLVEGTVEHVSADSADSATNNGSNANDKMPARSPPLFYKALVTLKAMQLEMGEQRFALGAGMQTQAEILLGTRSVMEFLLSPVRLAEYEAGRERERNSLCVSVSCIGTFPAICTWPVTGGASGSLRPVSWYSISSPSRFCT